jgi:arabinan endo-1,5-alpha-L-arabinosidase
VRLTLDRRKLLLGALSVAGPRVSAGLAQTPEPLNPKLTGDLYPVHDPCIIKEGDTYYLFCTTPGADAPAQIPWYRSKDLMRWERGGHVLPDTPSWARFEVPGTQGCWAPDISFSGGRYFLYYACSTFGCNHSVIGLATNPTLDPHDPGHHWQDRGLVLESQTRDDFNALDPNRIIDRDGKHWLAFGSFWTGLKIIPLDPLTGKPVPNAERHNLARRPDAPDAIEGAFIIQRGDRYYLFASFDFCCRGARSTYYTVVGRSSRILGPYADRAGKPMMQGGGTIVLAAGADGTRWRGPGHVALLEDAGKDYIVYHSYDASHNGRPTLRIAPLGWTDDGWPIAHV